MANAKQHVRQEALLEEYKMKVLAQQMHINVVLARKVSLQYKRAGLSQSKKLTDAKRAEWNQLAKEWRAEKERVLAEAVRQHKPLFDLLNAIGKNLTGRERDIFLRKFHTFNGYYTKVDAKLRASTLTDL